MRKVSQEERGAWQSSTERGVEREQKEKQERKREKQKKLTCVDLDPGLDQHAHAVELAVAAGKVQRGPAFFRAFFFSF